MKKISVIIVTYNSLKFIGDCLSSIFKYNDIGEFLEVIIVDNHSDDQLDLFEYVKRRFGDKVTLIDSGDNCGYGKGNNIGIRRAKGEVVVVMNPDVRLVDSIFANILSQIKESNVGMLGVDFVDGSCPYYFKRDYTTVFRELFFRYYQNRRKFDSKKMFLSGSFLVFKRDIFFKAGSFDENIFMYSEEADISNRISLLGFNIIWCPNIRVLHLAHGRSFNKKLDRIRLESGLYYEKKYGLNSEKIYKTTLKVLTIKIIISRLIHDSFKYENLRKFLDNLRQFHHDNIQYYNDCNESN